jgi:hypothetical protein
MSFGEYFSTHFAPCDSPRMNLVSWAENTTSHPLLLYCKLSKWCLQSSSHPKSEHLDIFTTSEWSVNWSGHFCLRAIVLAKLYESLWWFACKMWCFMSHLSGLWRVYSFVAVFLANINDTKRPFDVKLKSLQMTPPLATVERNHFEHHSYIGRILLRNFSNLLMKSQ